MCAACCECLGPIAGCNCFSSVESPQKHDPDCSVAMVQQCFQRLFPVPVSSTGSKGMKSPSHYSFSSFQSK